MWRENRDDFLAQRPPEEKHAATGREDEKHKKYLFYFYDYCVSLLLSHMNIILEYEMNFPCKISFFIL